MIRAEDKASGRALVGVQLEVLARDGERREVSTQGTGEVRVDNLSPGLYDISGEIAGYGKVVAAAVRVTPRKTNTLLLELVRRGDKLEEVVVSAQSLRRDLSGDVIAYLDIVNLLGETDSEALELNPRTGRFEEQEGDTQPNIGLKFEWAW